MGHLLFSGQNYRPVVRGDPSSFQEGLFPYRTKLQLGHKVFLGQCVYEGGMLLEKIGFEESGI